MLQSSRTDEWVAAIIAGRAVMTSDMAKARRFATGTEATAALVQLDLVDFAVIRLDT